jgi:hypothetical protein
MRIAAFMILFLLIIANLTIKARFPPNPRTMTKEELAQPFKEVKFILLLCGFLLLTFGIFIPIDYVVAEAYALGMSYNLAQYLLAMLNAGRYVFIPVVIFPDIYSLDFCFFTFMSNMLTSPFQSLWTSWVRRFSRSTWLIQYFHYCLLPLWHPSACSLDPCRLQCSGYCLRDYVWVLIWSIRLVDCGVDCQNFTPQANWISNWPRFSVRFYRWVNDQPYCWCHSSGLQWIVPRHEDLLRRLHHCRDVFRSWGSIARDRVQIARQLLKSTYLGYVMGSVNSIAVIKHCIAFCLIYLIDFWF